MLSLSSVPNSYSWFHSYIEVRYLAFKFFGLQLLQTLPLTVLAEGVLDVKFKTWRGPKFPHLRFCNKWEDLKQKQLLNQTHEASYPRIEQQELCLKISNFRRQLNVEVNLLVTRRKISSDTSWPYLLFFSFKSINHILLLRFTAVRGWHCLSQIPKWLPMAPQLWNIAISFLTAPILEYLVLCQWLKMVASMHALSLVWPGDWDYTVILYHPKDPQIWKTNLNVYVTGLLFKQTRKSVALSNYTKCNWIYMNSLMVLELSLSLYCW